MSDSILISVKKKLNVPLEDSFFDDDIIDYINSVFNFLTQIGAGPSSGFHITGATETWTDYDSNINKLLMLKSYVYAKVRLMFDPPTSSIAMEALNKCISEFEARISYVVS